MKRVVVLICLLSFIAASAFVMGCGGGGNDQVRIKDVADKFMTAINEKDANAVIEVVTKNDKKGLDVEELEKEAEQSEDEPIEYEIGEVEIEGDTAVVKVLWKFDEESIEMPIYLDKEDGSWKVNLAKSDFEDTGDAK
ncbi:MAG: DUF4878 domain-containing protein [Actinobacteria bacterium]|nr:DUF4878 domain-containing protein [Actinomycetota bacterium]